MTAQVNRLGHTWLSWAPFQQRGSPTSGAAWGWVQRGGWGQGLFPSAWHLVGGFWGAVLSFRLHSSEERLTSWGECNQGPLILWGNWNTRCTETLRELLTWPGEEKVKRASNYCFRYSQEVMGKPDPLTVVQQKNKRQQSQVAVRQV